ncbi:MAG: prepilin-type N-terminal cleavage/methylation domain-containing protein [Pirellulales bacterium]
MQSVRSGLTLIELLLVLALMVVFAALAAPTLRGSMENRKLNIAADALRAAWAQARVEAMQSGNIQGFRFEQGGEQYRLQPYYGPDELAGAENLSADEVARSEFVVAQEDHQLRLAEGITFVAAHQVIDRRGAEAAAALEEADVLGGSLEEIVWSPPILFYPDGTCSSANVLLRNRNGRLLEVSLRALTGTSRVGEVFAE